MFEELVGRDLDMKTVEIINQKYDEFKNKVMDSLDFIADQRLRESVFRQVMLHSLSSYKISVSFLTEIKATFLIKTRRGALLGCISSNNKGGWWDSNYIKEEH